jgi:hypothetical protein
MNASRFTAMGILYKFLYFWQVYESQFCYSGLFPILIFGSDPIDATAAHIVRPLYLFCARDPGEGSRNIEAHVFTHRLQVSISIFQTTFL